MRFFLAQQYNISQGDLENRTLWVTVWHSDRFGRNDFLGEVTIPMDLHRFGDTTPKTYTLQSRVSRAQLIHILTLKGGRGYVMFPPCLDCLDCLAAF